MPRPAARPTPTPSRGWASPSWTGLVRSGATTTPPASGWTWGASRPAWRCWPRSSAPRDGQRGEEDVSDTPEVSAPEPLRDLDWDAARAEAFTRRMTGLWTELLATLP